MVSQSVVIFSIISIIAFIAVFFTTLQFAEVVSSQDVSFVYNEDTDGENKVLPPLLINIGLLLVFMVQHSFMATTWWKTQLDDVGLLSIERSLYVMTTAATLKLLMYYWQAMPIPELWFIDTRERSGLWLFFTLVHIIAWVLIYSATLTMDFAELVGLKQVYYYSQGLDHPLTYKSRGAQKLYKHMRHPGTCCFLIILWLHPIMTWSRFIFATILTVYLLLGFNVKESDYVYVQEQITRKRITIEERYLHVD